MSGLINILDKDRIDKMFIPDRAASSGFVQKLKANDINATASCPDSVMDGEGQNLLDNINDSNSKVIPLIGASYNNDDSLFYSGNLKKSNRALVESRLIKSYSSQFDDQLKLSAQSTSPLNSLYAEFITKIRFR